MFNTKQEAYTAFRGICAERTDSVIAWVGSGLSASAGLPTWKELRDKLCNALKKKAASMGEADRLSMNNKSNIAREQENLWNAFAILKRALGKTTYQEKIKSILAPAATCSVPTSYSDLWKLPLSGILNLNLDRLASRAYGEANSGKLLNEFNGKDAGQFIRLLKSPTHQFVANLHGVLTESRSWVLTKKEMQDLLKEEGYIKFIEACLCSKTILFIGVSADDIVVGGHLERLLEINVDPGAHYWITNRLDRDTDEWAEKAGIQVIRYESKGSDHKDLDGFINDLLTYLPEDDTPPPVASLTEFDNRSPLPEPEKLCKMDAEKIRKILNIHAQKILKPGTQDSYSEFEEFSKKYDQAIYHAWYVNESEPNNSILGYKLKDHLANGAFGNVFRAEDKKGDNVAIKVLHEGVRRNQNMLQSFRRGVRSMRILSEHKVRGMVPYIEASEIPQFAVMELINGPDLREAVESKYIEDWDIILRIADDLAKIFRKAHRLPERVLHRDIRPQNIMLKEFYYNPDNWEVVVLDFDLSWHRDSFETSVFSENAPLGYLAPEQREERKGCSTRNAAVDSFGLGMTLYFLCTGKQPKPFEHQHENWQTSLAEIKKMRCNTWCSLSSRFARLIENATFDDQMKRWDMTQIHDEIERLREAESDPALVQSAELFAEEVLSRSKPISGYTWNQDLIQAEVTTRSGVDIRISGNEVNKEVLLNVSWNRKGIHDRKKVGKWVRQACECAKAKLNTGMWKRIETSYDKSAGTASVNAKIPVAVLCNYLDKASSSLGDAIDDFRFN